MKGWMAGTAIGIVLTLSISSCLHDDESVSTSVPAPITTVTPVVPRTVSSEPSLSQQLGAKAREWTDACIQMGEGFKAGFARNFGQSSDSKQPHRSTKD